MTMKKFSFAFVLTLILSLVIGGCSGQDDGSETNTIAADNEKVVRDFIEAYNSADTDTVISFFADDAVYEEMALGQVFRGKKEISDFFNMVYTDFSDDLAWEIASIFSAGNKVVFESIFSGTQIHSGIPEIKASGKHVTFKAASIVELQNGKIIRFADYYDLSPFLQQAE